MAHCPFCSLDPGSKWIENADAIAFADAYPVTNGHTLVIPRQHARSIYELAMDQESALWELVAEVRNRLPTDLHPDGFNIAVTDGLAAGQTIEHAHVHVSPRHAHPHSPRAPRRPRGSSHAQRTVLAESRVLSLSRGQGATSLEASDGGQREVGVSVSIK